MKICVREVELTKGLESITVPDGYSSVRVLVRLRRKPLGWIELRSTQEKRDFKPKEIQDAIAKNVGYYLTRELFLENCANGLADGPVHRRPISVIVCTRDRPELLARALQALSRLDYPAYEVVVVDNASKGSATRQVTESSAFRYVREDRPGLNWARNRGVLEAKHDILAFTDDDACADDQWLAAINRSFAEPGVMGTTGLVLPAEIETKAQEYFEFVYGGMGKGMLPRRFMSPELTPRRLLWASGFGVGANMSFRRETFRRVGLFDPALDVGTPTGGGGDIEMFHRTVAKGLLLRYEPGAIVWHKHRSDFEGLKRQIFNNGCCMVPFLITCLRNRTVSQSAAARFFLQDVLCGWTLKRLIKRGRHRRSFVVAELRGNLAGFFAYSASRRQAAQLAGSSGGERLIRNSSCNAD